VGITDHAQHELTDIVFCEVPAVGKSVKAGRRARSSNPLRQRVTSMRPFPAR